MQNLEFIFQTLKTVVKPENVEKLEKLSIVDLKKLYQEWIILSFEVEHKISEKLEKLSK
jgi:hypothetical protein